MLKCERVTRDTNLKRDGVCVWGRGVVHKKQPTLLYGPPITFEPSLVKFSQFKFAIASRSLSFPPIPHPIGTAEALLSYQVFHPVGTSKLTTFQCDDGKNN